MNDLMNKYPWIRYDDPYPEPTDEPMTFLDWIPKGWTEAFGDILCEEMDAAIKAAGIENEFHVEEAKEKYGALVLFFSPTSKELNDIERRYRAISETVCCNCGEIHDVRMITRGWVSPYCRKCFVKLNPNLDLEYFDSLPEEKLPDTVKWTQYSKDNGRQTYEEDITSTTDKIKEKYNKRGNNNE